MQRNPATLAAIGAALYGPGWQAPMAKALVINDRTLRRWLTKEFPIPDGIWGELRQLCQERGVKLADWAEKLA